VESVRGGKGRSGLARASRGLSYHSRVPPERETLESLAESTGGRKPREDKGLGAGGGRGSSPRGIEEGGRGGRSPSSVRIRSPALQGACKSKPLVPASYLHLASSLGPPSNRVRAPLESAPASPCRILSLMFPSNRHPSPLERGSASIHRASGTPCPRCWAGRARRRGREGGQGGAARRKWRGGRGARWMWPRPPTPTPTCRSGAARVPYIYTPPHTAPDHPHPLHSAYNPPQPPRALLEAPPSPGSPCSPASLRRLPRAPVRLVEFETSLGPPTPHPWALPLLCLW